MIVQKFGGTSVEDGAAIERLAGIVQRAVGEGPVVVVSAMGKTTDRLVAALARATAGDEGGALEQLAAVSRDTLAAVDEIFGAAAPAVAAELAPLFAGLGRMAAAVAVLSSVPADARDHFLAQGELVSSLVVARALAARGVPAVRVDARDVLVTDAHFGRAQPDFRATEAAARERLAGPVSRRQVPVIGGFVGATAGGQTTVLGRGGSDYSAAIFGACLGASRVEIWTDVDGMMTADPRIVPEARVLDRLSAEEASELAYFGARVLHPLTLAPAIEKGIPVRVLNARRPERPGTEILSGAPGGEDVRSIACKRGIVTVEVSTSRMLMAPGFLRALFDVFARFDTAVDMISTSEVSVSVTLDDSSRVAEIRRELEQMARVDVVPGRAIVCLVGENLKFTSGIAARIFRAVEDVNVLMISQGASRRNVSFVVAEEDVERAVRHLHREFFGEAAAPGAVSTARAGRV
ncbi:MAG TPA: lysine-sensitive aspartokinase 3 [Thermoanaerobaculia bacterium]|nr:lysine-sensitive aspartokinase 3 [Thermoanaerobaculia bacterium]